MLPQAVLMTSFFQSRKSPFPCYSAAVYQPRGFAYPKIDWTDIRDANGSWIRPREFLGEPDPAKAYYAAMLAHYDEREEEAVRWAEACDCLTMCCWCPFDRAAKRQLQEFGSFICHTGPLGEFIETRLNIPVFYDRDRLSMYRGSDGEAKTETEEPRA
jgi:hypothetical protein